MAAEANIDYLIYRYLKEKGYFRSAFEIVKESKLALGRFDPNSVPDNALVALVQRSMNDFKNQSSNTGPSTSTGANSSFETSFSNSITISPKTREQVAAATVAALEKYENEPYDNELEHFLYGKSDSNSYIDFSSMSAYQPSTSTPCNNLHDLDPVTINKPTASQSYEMELQNDVSLELDQFDGYYLPILPVAATATAITTTSAPATATPDSDSSNCFTLVSVKRVFSHVNCCLWNPKHDELAVAIRDATTRVWDYSRMLAAHSSELYVPPDLKMQLSPRSNALQNVDIKALDWHPDGMKLLTASFDGCVYLWDTTCSKLRKLTQHDGAVMAAKWNAKGDKILTTSLDSSVFVLLTKNCKRLYKHFLHQAPVLDATWLDDTMFATCSQDGVIMVCRLGVLRPKRKITAHYNAVNSLHWNAQHSLLASGGEDATVKIWSLISESQTVSMTGHSAAVKSVRWSKSGSQAATSDGALMLASASSDCTVRLWDVNSSAYSCLRKHSEPVVSINFSPDGLLLASGSHDKWINVHDVRDNRIVHAYQTDGTVNDVSWNSRGDLLAAGTSIGSVYVFDVRTLGSQTHEALASNSAIIDAPYTCLIN